MNDQPPSMWSTIRIALALVWSAGRAQVIVVLVATTVTSFAIAGQLLVGRGLLDLITGSESVPSTELVPYLVALGAMLLVSAVSQALATELRVPLGEKVHRGVTRQILDVATEVEVEAYEDPKFHDRLVRAQAGARDYSSAVVWGIVSLITTVFVAIGVTAVLFTVSPYLVPIVVVGYIPVALVNVKNNRALHRMEWDLAETQRRRHYMELLLVSRHDAKEIRSYGVAPVVRSWHEELWDERLRRLRTIVNTRLALITLVSTLTTLVMVGTLALVLVMAVRETITVGDAAIAVVGLQQLSGRLRSATTAFAGTHQGVIFLRDFKNFRALLPELRERRPTARPPARPTSLRVESLGYRYPGADVDALADVSFELRRGQVLAIVGANGSGKSTLAKLLCGLLPPTRGCIRWDGVDISTCDPDLVRASIAPVFQDYVKFQLKLRDAVGLGDVNRLDDLEAIRTAADHAGVGYLFEAFPEGADAQLGKFFTGGTDLSVGQWQRLAIARAFFRDSPIVILDEPSASLDPQGEADLFDRLRALCNDRLVIFVSHRFATVRSADAVMVMDQARVVEFGSHSELMSAGGLYRDLFELQADRYGLTYT